MHATVSGSAAYADSGEYARFLGITAVAVPPRDTAVSSKPLRVLPGATLLSRCIWVSRAILWAYSVREQHA